MLSFHRTNNMYLSQGLAADDSIESDVRLQTLEFKIYAGYISSAYHWSAAGEVDSRKWIFLFFFVSLHDPLIHRFKGQHTRDDLSFISSFITLLRLFISRFASPRVQMWKGWESENWAEFRGCTRMEISVMFDVYSFSIWVKKLVIKGRKGWVFLFPLCPLSQFLFLSLFPTCYLFLLMWLDAAVFCYILTLYISLYICSVLPVCIDKW